MTKNGISVTVYLIVCATDPNYSQPQKENLNNMLNFVKQFCLLLTL